jgi:hypothetical protein
MRGNGRACSSSNASSSSVRSSPQAAVSMVDVGSPSASRSPGTEIAGRPATLWSGVNATWAASRSINVSYPTSGLKRPSAGVRCATTGESTTS